MTYRYLPVCAGMILLAGCSASPNMSLGAADNSFIMQAASGGLSEVQLGQMAQQKATSPAVQQFGAQMVQDHTPQDKELVALAVKKGVTPPAGPDAAHTAISQQLSTLSGRTFDQQYLASQQQDHQLQVKLYQEEAQNGTDPDVRAFAAKYLPTLQHHLQEVQSVMSASSASPAG
jgi:putative membrane protein